MGGGGFFLKGKRQGEEEREELREEGAWWKKAEGKEFESETCGLIYLFNVTLISLINEGG